MPENDATANAGESVSQDSFKAPASQEELDRIIQNRLNREREKFADYNDVKSQLESEMAKSQELEARVAELTEKVSGYESEKARAALVKKVAEETGVSAEVLRGETEDELKAHAEQLQALLKPSAPVIQSQDKTPSAPAADPNKEFVGKLFGN